MILFSIGLPGRFTELCTAAMARLAAHAGGTVATAAFPPFADLFGYHAVPSSLEALGRLLVKSAADHAAIGLRQPDQTFCELLARRDTPFLVALDDPRNAVADVVAETGVDLRSAVRAVANSCPLVMQPCALPGALAIQADRARGDPAGTVSAIAAHFGIAARAKTVAAIAGEFFAADAGASPAAGSMCDGALLGYRELFSDGNLGQLIWTRDLFHQGTDGSSLNAPIDVAGSPLLFYGPYIHLPGGSWSAQIILGFSAEAANYTYLVEAFADAQLAATTFRPEIPGIYRAELRFSVAGAIGRGVEIRLIVADNQARGQVAFGQVVLRPLAVHRADASAPATEDFTHVLAL